MQLAQHPHRSHRGGDRNRGVAGLDQTWPGAVRPGRWSTGGRRPAAAARDLHRRALHPELEHAHVAEPGSDAVDQADDAVGARPRPPPRSCARRPSRSPRCQASSIHGLLVVLAPAPVLGRHEPMGALPALGVAAGVPAGRRAAEDPVGGAHPVPLPLHDAEALDEADRLEPHLQAGGEVGHGEARGECALGEAPGGRFGEVVGWVRRPSVVERDDGGGTWAA